MNNGTANNKNGSQLAMDSSVWGFNVAPKKEDFKLEVEKPSLNILYQDGKDSDEWESEYKLYFTRYAPEEIFGTEGLVFGGNVARRTLHFVIDPSIFPYDPCYKINRRAISNKDLVCIAIRSLIGLDPQKGSDRIKLECRVIPHVMNKDTYEIQVINNLIDY